MYFYELYYGTRNSSIRISGPGEGVAILAADSYGGAIKRLLAENYETLFTEWCLGDGKTDLHALESSIKEHKPDVVYIVGTYENMLDVE